MPAALASAAMLYELGVELQAEEAWKKSGRTDVPCLFDPKCSFLSQLSGLPLDLEHAFDLMSLLPFVRLCPALSS